MLGESENRASLEKLQSDAPNYLKLADVIHEPGIEKLLAERMKGKTIPHEEVIAEAKRRIQQARRGTD